MNKTQIYNVIDGGKTNVNVAAWPRVFLLFDYRVHAQGDKGVERAAYAHRLVGVPRIRFPASVALVLQSGTG